jgi:hypothetical protein
MKNLATGSRVKPSTDITNTTLRKEMAEATGAM